MLRKLESIDLTTLPLNWLKQLAGEELSENTNPTLHVVIHHAEIGILLNSLKRKFWELWFSIWSERYAWASIIRSVPSHTDLDLPEDEAFLLVVTHVDGGGVNFYVWNESITLAEWQVIYFDPHIRHGVKTDTPNSNASVVRITVKKI
jgi:hypothetical protein